MAPDNGSPPLTVVAAAPSGGAPPEYDETSTREIDDESQYRCIGQRQDGRVEGSRQEQVGGRINPEIEEEPYALNAEIGREAVEVRLWGRTRERPAAVEFEGRENRAGEGCEACHHRVHTRDPDQKQQDCGVDAKANPAHGAEPQKLSSARTKTQKKPL